MAMTTSTVSEEDALLRGEKQPQIEEDGTGREHGHGLQIEEDGTGPLLLFLAQSFDKIVLTVHLERVHANANLVVL